MNNGITLGTDDPSTSERTANILRDEAFDSRLNSLRDVALELLKAVESLRSQKSDREDYQLNLREEVRKFETGLIRAALVHTRGNQFRAARLLEVKNTTLSAKIKRYGISNRGVVF